jgi:hypothetical protein
VRELKSAIDEVEFDRYAYLRAHANGTLMHFPIFVCVLDEIETIECRGALRHGQGARR